MRSLYGLLSRALGGGKQERQDRKRRGSLAPPSDASFSFPDVSLQDAKLILIDATQGGCFDTLEFNDFQEFSYLLAMALAHDATIFANGTRFARLLARYGRQLSHDELRCCLLHSAFLDAPRRHLTNATVEAALTACAPLLAVCFSRRQQEDLPHVIRCLRQDFAVMGSLPPALLEFADYASALAGAFPFQMGWALAPARAVLLKDLFGISAARADAPEDEGLRLGEVGMQTVALEDVYPGALLQLLRGWLRAPGCVQRLSDTVRDAFRSDRKRGEGVSAAAMGLFAEFSRAHVDPAVVRETLQHLWERDGLGPGARATMKGLVCASPNLRSLCLGADVMQAILSNAMRLCTHVRTAAAVLKLEAAQRERMNIYLVKADPAVETRLVSGPHTRQFPPPACGGRTVLHVPSREEFFRLHGGKVMVDQCSTRFMWNADFLRPYLLTAPHDGADDARHITVAEGIHRAGRSHLNILGMGLSDETRRMLPGGAQRAPMTRADLEWLAQIITDMPEFGEILLDRLVGQLAAEEVYVADRDLAPLERLLPCDLLLVGAKTCPNAAQVVRCGTPAELAAAATRFFLKYRGVAVTASDLTRERTLAELVASAVEARRRDAAEMKLYSFARASHANFMGILVDCITFEHFESELQHDVWWEPMLNEAVVRLHEEHAARLAARHHRLLAAQLLAWSNRVGLLFNDWAAGDRPTVRALFPGRMPLAYSDRHVEAFRETWKGVREGCVREFMRGVDPQPRPARGARIFQMIFMDCHGFAPEYGIEPEQRRAWCRLQGIQAARQPEAPRGGHAFWARFLADVAAHVNGGGPGRVYMPRVQTRHSLPTAWASMRDVRARQQPSARRLITPLPLPPLP